MLFIFKEMTSTKLSDGDGEKGVHKSSKTSTQFEGTAALEIAKERKCTNSTFLIIFAICVLFLIPLTAVFSKGTELNRFIYGYDKCGNTCGSKNSPVEGLNCSGLDMTDKPIALIKYQKLNEYCPYSKERILPEECVSTCNPPYTLIFHRCYPPEEPSRTLTDNSSNMKKLTEILHVVDQNLTVIVIMIISAIVFTFLALLSFRCHAVITFWFFTTFQLIAFVVTTTYLWHKYLADEESLLAYLFFALGTTIYLLFMIFFVVFFHGYLTFIFHVYEEAFNALFRIPILLIQPLLTLLVLVVTTTSMVLLMFLINSNKELEPSPEDPSTLEYVTNLPTAVYICYILFMIIWIYSFLDGSQTIIISGAISNYYFTRDKSSLHSSYIKSFMKLIKYHLGTAACGSLFVTCLAFMRSIAEYVVSKAYIQTALHGTPFCVSTVRGSKLVCSNLMNTVALTGVNYIVINGFSFMTVLATAIVGIWVNSRCDYTYVMWLGLLFGAVGGCLVTLFMLNMVNVATETIFFCFCEDKLVNDGESHPYYMNDKMKKIMEKFEKEKVDESDHI